MIGSLFKELPPLQNDEAEGKQTSEDLPYCANSDDSLLASLPVVQKIIRRKITLPLATEASDLAQGIILRLLKWRDKYREKSAEMSPDEWQSLAAQTTYNEINRHFAKNRTTKVVPIEAVEEIASPEVIEGTSDTEVFSLARLVWQEICSLSLRQRRALLLANQDIIINFLTCGITDEELAEILNLTMEEWEIIKEKLPLKNFQIAELIKKEGNEKSLESIINSIKKARHEARAKVRRLTDK
jgi:DNA-directed RNA polymerase specialized sigma24 family protein